MNDIGIFSFHEVDNAYSCLFYLKDGLKKNFSVKIYAGSKEDKIADEDYIGLREGKISGIRFLGGLFVRIRVIIGALCSRNIIVNDLEFFKIVYFIKKLCPKKKVIHYCTEIHGEDVKYKEKTVKFYENHADFPDMIIECLKERAEYRKKHFQINKNVFYIDNTLPEKAVIEKINRQIDISDYINFDKKQPILIYAGGCNTTRGLGKIIQSASLFEDKLNFLLFCYGNEADFASIKEMCSDKNNCKVHEAVTKDILFSVMNYCDIGIQFYDPNISVNHLYAAPSKFFEYLALGLNVISTNNTGINKIIEADHLGICLDENLDIKKALNELLDKGLNSKDYIKKIFHNKYSFEVESASVLGEIEKLIGGKR